MRFNVLIADDEEHIRLALSAMLRDHDDMDVEVVADGGAAWSLLQDVAIDIVIADIHMPELDGCALVQRMKADQTLRLVPAILITGHEAEDAGRVVFEAGADDFLTKPIEPAALRARLVAAQRLRLLHLELEQRNQELSDSLAYLRAAQEQVVRSQKLEAMGTLAAGIGHEINTPAQCVRANLHFLKDMVHDCEPLFDLLIRAGEDEGGQCCQQIRDVVKSIDVHEFAREAPIAIREASEALTRVTDIVAGMRSLSHPGDGTRCSCDIGKIVSQAVSICRCACPDEIALQLELMDAHPSLLLDVTSIQQVFMNLIINAIQAVQASNRPGWVWIRSHRRDGWLCVVVEDTGDGIDPTIKHRIFDPFFTTKQVGQGSGQGLSIANNIVERHGGRIRVESERGCGCRFIVELPVPKGSLLEPQR